MQFYLQLQHLHYLQYWYDTNIYTYNILTNYTTGSYTYTTYTCTTLQYDTKKKNLEKYETTYNTMLMLLRKILVLQYYYLQFDIIRNCKNNILQCIT